MDNKNNILKNAIAQSQLIKEASIAEVKKSFEEHFNPQIRSILSAKLNEMDENNVDDEMNEDIDLGSILAELEDEDTSLDEAKDANEDEKADKPKNDKPAKPKPKTDDAEDDEEVPVDDPDAFRDYVAKLVGELVADQGGESDDTIGDDLGGLDDEDMDMDFDLDSGKKKSDDLDEDFLFEFEEDFDGDGISDDFMGASSGYNPDTDFGDEDEMGGLYEAKRQNAKLQRQLKESKLVLNKINQELTESNLVKQKLEFINKLFRNKTLSESQKLKVIGSFDKAKNTKEAKLVFESLNGLGVNKAPVNNLKRNLGFASKSTGSRGSINESKQNNIIDPQVARWMKLAGIKN